MKKTLLALVCLFLYTNSFSAEVKNVIIKNFTLGNNTTQSPSKIYERRGKEILGYSPLSYNVNSDVTGALTRREGFVTISSAPIDKVWTYKKSTNESFLMILIGGSLYSATDVTVSSTTYTLLTSDLQSNLNEIRAAVADDKFWVTDGISTVGSFNGTTWVTYSYIPSFKYILGKGNRLNLANGYGSASTLRYSSIIGVEGLDTRASWGTTQEIFFGKNDGDSITSMFTDKGNLIMGKSRSIWKLVGYSLSDWYKLKVSNYYGLPFMDTIQPHKNTYLGVSNRKSVISYDTLDNVDNFIGGTNYLHISGKGGFDSGTYSRANADLGYLELASGTTEWNTIELFNTGTHSRTSMYGSVVAISTSSAPTIVQIPNTSLSVDVKMYQDNFIYDGDTAFVWKKEKDIVRDRKEIPLVVANDDKVIDGDQDTFITLRLSDFGYRNYYELTNGATYEKQETYRFLIDIGLGKNYNSLARVDIYGSYIDVDYNWNVFPDKGLYLIKPYTLARYKFSLLLHNLQLGEYVNYRHIPSAALQRWIRGRYDRHPIETFSWTSDLSVGVTVPLTNTVRLEVGCYEFNVHLRNFNDDTVRLYTTDVFRVNEVEVFYNSVASAYYSTAAYTSSVASHGDGTYDFYGGTFTVIDESDYETYGTTVVYFTRTSTNNVIWESWEQTPNNTHFSTIAFRYTQWKATMATDNTEYTPAIFDVTMEAIVATGTWVDKKRNTVPIYQRAYFIAEQNLPVGTTVTYWVSYTTSSTMTETYTKYDSIADVSSIQSTRTYVRHKVGLETTDGRAMPRINSITQTWNPFAEYINPKSIVFENNYRLAVTTYGTSNTLEHVYDNNGAWWENRGLNIDGYFTWNFKNYFYNSNGIHEFRDDVYTDNGSVISCSWESPDIIVSDLGKIVELDHIRLHALQTGTTVVFEWKARDYSDTYSSTTVLLDGTGVDIKRINIPVMKNGKIFRFRIRDNTKQRLEVYGIDIYYREREWFH